MPGRRQSLGANPGERQERGRLSVSGRSAEAPARDEMIRAVIGTLVMLAGVAAATPAGAHASLLSSYPPDSILMQAQPGTVALTFNEAVSVVELQVTDANGGRHA